MPSYRDRRVVMEDVRLIFRNFSGKEGLFNREGERSFSVLLDEDIAKVMAQDGWNVKWLKAIEPGDPDQAHLSVAVSYKKRPPRVVLITSKNRTTLDERTIGSLDYADIRTVDLIVVPSEWEVNGKTGIKAYLKSIYVTIEEDELELKYAENND